MAQPYQKPPRRKGLICWYCQWNPDGTIKQALYRKPHSAPNDPGEDRSTSSRGLIATEQGELGI